MKFEVYGKTLEYNVELENYNQIRKEVMAMITDMESSFEAKFYSRFSNMNEAVRGIYGLCDTYLEPLFEWALKYLNQMGIYEYDRKRFENTYFAEGYVDVSEAIVSIGDKVAAIDGETEEMRQYRKARKDSRSRWEGGGFGVEGAIQGAMIAGSANLASGMVHSGVNAVGNLVSNIEASSQKKKIYKSKSTINTYIDGLGNTMFCMIRAVVEAIQENSEIEIEPPTKEQQDRAGAIFNNIEAGYIQGEDALVKAVEALQGYPYNAKIYRYLLDNFYDEKNELVNLAEFFGIHTVQEAKNEKRLELLRGINFHDAGERKTGEQAALEELAKYGADTEALQAVFEEIEQLFILNSMTVDGAKYETVELANQADTQLQLFVKEVEKTSGNDVDKIHGLMEQMKNSGVLSKGKYINYLEKELKEEEQRYLYIKGKVYSNREEAAIARKDALLLDEVFDGKEMSCMADIQAAKDIVAEEVTSDLGEIYLELLKEMQQCLEEQIAIVQNPPECEQNIRGKHYLRFCQYDSLHQKAESYHVRYPEFESLYTRVYDEYHTVVGKKYNTVNEANQAYFKAVKHAKAYIEYINQKNNEKKSFFAALKNNVTGIVNQRYEEDFNALTQNGQTSLPLEDVDALAVLNVMIPDHLTELEKVELEFEEKYGRLRESGAIKEKSMSCASMVVHTEPVKNSAITAVLKQVAPEIRYGSVLSKEPLTEEERMMAELEELDDM